ncbi:hypothetical protein TraAM80_02656 [Trypanosoma rangeli]|uniref:Uncharacterized protein n=1 Tax=Trypanosoma rangeli TaxID=5698 RepID=A0A422NT30_TRYRA|nr:uncharacterized protein TraAM80_02656 [Trypanosoma rangeli]RNF08630.1 hypothetical protein TraAM80_02656 [Trypanosoma rangeli]|eukprot:RNF08630.1 hypothetical protein TraAM80_02656 [Trypanosoma rangeli]
MRRRTPSMQRQKRYKLEGEQRQQPAVEAVKATPHTTMQHKKRGSATPMTEQETATLFLADLAPAAAHTTGTAAVVPAFAIEKALTDGNKEESLASARRRGKKSPLVRKTACEGKHASAFTKTCSGAKPSALGQTELSALPLEEGEEDPSVATEVLRQTAAFLARLTPARSKQFWVLRQVARGELGGRSAAKLSTTVPASDDDDEEDEDEEGVDLAASEDEMSSSSEEENMSPPLPSPPPTAKKMNAFDSSKRTQDTKRRGGGALFSSNPDVWED